MSALWQKYRIVICMGDGGVGKTSVAAALAMAAAKAHRRVLVLTIDPSRRLAQALNFSEEELARGVGVATPAEVTHPDLPPQKLFAQWLDVQATFDAIIRKRASSEEAAERIIDNLIYRQFSRSLAGSHEYAAVEKLFEVQANEAYDLIVLDTPPSQNAMDFLGAPRRIIDFLDNGRLPKMLEHPMWQKGGIRRLFDVGTRLVTKTLDSVVGAETLAEIGVFLHGLREMYDGFRERAIAIEKLLASAELAYLVVGTAGRSQRATLETLTQDLARAGARPSAIVVNRMPSGTGDSAAVARLVANVADQDETMQELTRALEEEERRFEEARLGAMRVKKAFAPIPVTLCPEARAVAQPVDAVLSLVGYFEAG